MTELTPLDTAHDAMQAAPEDDRARLRFYERLADSELFLMLTMGDDRTVVETYVAGKAMKSTLA